MAQQDAEMARARARYASTQRQGDDIAKVKAPKAPATLPANRRLPEYVIDPTRPDNWPNQDHNAPITVASVATTPRGDRSWSPMVDTRTNRLDKSYMGAASHWMPYGAVSMTPDMRRKFAAFVASEADLNRAQIASVNHCVLTW